MEGIYLCLVALSKPSNGMNLGVSTMKIGNRVISSKTTPLVIAEIGINHGGCITVAKNMVRLVAESGCECVKHQTHIVEDEMTEEAKSIFPPNADKSIWDVMTECALSRDEEIELKKYAESLGLIWISTPFSRAAADFLDEIDVPAYKIGSGECNHLPLIRHIAQKGKPVIMSTGMQNIQSIEASVSILREADIPFALLECTNLYPSPPEIVSLQGISELQKAFPDALVGFSDHSIGPQMAIASVALGATIVERHFTDSRYRIGPTKEIHTALRNPKQRSSAEEDVYRFARASVVADADLAAGHEITASDIWARRPGTGEIPGYKFDELIGKKLKHNVRHNQQLKWNDFVQ